MTGDVHPVDRYQEILVTLGRVEQKLDNFIQSHSSVHSTEQAHFNQHLMNSAVMGERGMQISGDIQILANKMEAIEQWRAEVRGMTTVVRMAFGTSIIAAAAAAISIIASISDWTHS